MMEEGDKLPAVTLTAMDGAPLALHSLIGQPLLLYFYPKDDTSGCTREAQDFSAALPEFERFRVRLLGVSRDSPAKHQKFVDKYDLAVPLATDGDGSVLAAFGVWIEKQLYGKRYMGIDRSTFLFDAEGVLLRCWRKVKVPGHVVNVLEAIRELR